MFAALIFSLIRFVYDQVDSTNVLKLVVFLLTVAICALGRNVNYYKKYPLAFLLSPFYGFLHLFILQPLKFFSLATIRNTSWGTRKATPQSTEESYARHMAKN